jgi:hypothetical protein
MAEPQGAVQARPCIGKGGVDMIGHPPHFGSDMTRTAHTLGNCQRAITGSAAAVYYNRSGRTGPI